MEKIFGYRAQELADLGALTTAQEIRQQPGLWKQTYHSLKEQKQSIGEFMHRALAIPGLRIILTGAGSSAFAGECTAPYLSKRLSRTVEAIATTDIVSSPMNYLIPEVPTLLISYARSGDSPESIAAIDIADEVIKNVYHVVLTCNRGGELAKRFQSRGSDLLLLMPEASNDKGFAMTGSFTCMALTTLLIFDIDGIEGYRSTVDSICAAGEKYLEEGCGRIKEAAGRSFNRLVYLGSGCLKGLAREAALKMLELSAGKVMTGFDSPLAFRHGPKSVIDESTLIISFVSNEAYTRQYDIDLIREIHREKSGNRIIAVSGKAEAELDSIADTVLVMEQQGKAEQDDVFLIFDFILIAQTLAFFKSLSFGVEPDNPSPNGIVNRVVRGVRIYRLRNPELKGSN